jgi:hypothetical protein
MTKFRSASASPQPNHIRADALAAFAHDAITVYHAPCWRTWTSETLVGCLACLRACYAEESMGCSIGYYSRRYILASYP